MMPERFDEPGLSIQQAQRYLREEASLKRRIIYSLLAALDAGMVVLLTALWTTEPHLPVRTHIAFGAMLAVALAWLCLFGWTLGRRRPLFALDRVIAGRLSLVATTMFLAGGILIAAQRGHWPGLVTVALVGGMFVAAAATVLVRAMRTRRSLLRKRDELTALLASKA